MNCFEGYTIREVSIEKWWKTLNNLVIVRGGHTCRHSYFNEIETNREGWRKIVIADFFSSAYKGSGDKEAFMRERKDWCDAEDLWNHFKRSYDGLKRLDPDGYQEALKIGEMYLKRCCG